MPPAADESHPPPGIPDEPENAEGEESDEYDIEVSDCSFRFIHHLNTMVGLLKDDGDEEPEYAGEDDEEEGEQNGVSARLTSP
jgi:hypothetical protein